MQAVDQSVVVTGASSGIGEATALHLDELGFSVLAGVRRDADGEALSQRASERLTPIRLDVTDTESIAAAVAAVDRATPGRLYGLVNNAGLSINGPLELVPIEVARAVANALTTARPKPHYLIGPGAKKMKNLSRLPAGLRDWMLAKALYSRRSA